MNRRGHRPLRWLAVAALTAAAWPQAAGRPVVVDRIAVVVNRQPILQSEVVAAARFARFSAALVDNSSNSGSRASQVAPTPAEKNTALQHLVDDALLRQAGRLEDYAPDPRRLAAALADQWSHLARLAGGAAGLDRRLAAHGLDRVTVNAILTRQITLLDFLDQHFSAAALITPEQVETYYREQVVPAAQRRRLRSAPLAQVQAEIKEILTEQKRDALEQQWLSELRGEATIRIMPVFAAGEVRP